MNIRVMFMSKKCTYRNLKHVTVIKMLSYETSASYNLFAIVALKITDHRLP